MRCLHLIKIESKDNAIFKDAKKLKTKKEKLEEVF